MLKQYSVNAIVNGRHHAGVVVADDGVRGERQITDFSDFGRTIVDGDPHRCWQRFTVDTVRYTYGSDR